MQSVSFRRDARRTEALTHTLRGILAIGWLIGATGVALLSATSSLLVPNIWNTVSSDGAFYIAVERQGLWINLGLYGLPMLCSVAIALLRPRWWRRSLLCIAILPLLVGAMTSGRLTALLTVIAILLPACWAGRELAQHLAPTADRATAWTLGAAVGIGLLALIGFVCGLLGLLRPLVLWPLLLGMLVWLTLSAARARLTDDLAAAARSLRRPVVPTPARLILTGLLIATAWSVSLGALTPETASDAARQRVPAALSFASTRHLETNDVGIIVTNLPALGEALYATLLAVGPLPAAKILALVAGVVCVLLAMQLGRRLGGKHAGALAAFSFTTMPLVIWLGQTAYLDLFTCLAALAAALFLLTPSSPTRAAALACGLCCGWGMAVKLHFAYVAIGLGITLLLLAMDAPGRFSQRTLHALVLALTYGAGAATVALLPFVRSAILTGQIPGLTLATQSLGRTSTVDLGDLTEFGYGRDFHDLILLPLNLVINSLGFEWVPTAWGPFNGLLGYLPIILMPLLIMARFARRARALWWGMAVAALFWFFSAQYLRYGLPIVALLCPIGAAAFEDVRRRCTDQKLKQTLAVLLLVLAVAGVAIQARVPTYSLDFVLGRQDEAAYLDRYLFCCAGTAILQLLDAQPDAARAYALYDPPRLYARTPLIAAPKEALGARPLDMAEPGAALAALDAGGYTHLIISRRYIPAEWSNSPLMDETFLRRYTILVGNGPNTYLYRILPPAARGVPIPWTIGPELLVNGDFESAAPAGGPVGWAVREPTGADLSGDWSIYYVRGVAAASGTAAILVDPNAHWLATVPILPGHRYLLDTASRAAVPAGNGQVTLTLLLEWRDATGVLLGTSSSSVPVTDLDYHHFSLAADAPPGAVSATVILSTTTARIWVDDLSLRETAGGVEAGIGP